MNEPVRADDYNVEPRSTGATAPSAQPASAKACFLVRGAHRVEGQAAAGQGARGKYDAMKCLLLSLLSSAACACDLTLGPPKPDTPGTVSTRFGITNYSAIYVADHMDPVWMSIAAHVSSITIHTDRGDIRIDYHTGAVTYPPGTDLDEGARRFWDAIKRMCPRDP